eukprot:s423_g6.t1
MLHCPAMESVREQHPHTVQILTDQCPGWIDHPVIFTHPLQDFVIQLERMPGVVVSNEAKQILQHVIGHGLTLYSDGSSLYQASSSSRFASFALVADIAPDDKAHLHQATRSLATKQEPDTLQTIARGRVQGQKGIHRAELSIITIACESFEAFDLHTDSAASLPAIGRVRQAAHPVDFAAHPDFDLLLRLHQVLKVTRVFHMIKAHVQLDDHACNLQLYHQLGNKRANDVAIETSRQLFPDAVREFDQYHADLSSEQD